MLVDSTSAFERRWMKVASMAVRWRVIVRTSSTKAGMQQRVAQESHRPSAVSA